MHDLAPSQASSPADIVADLERRAERHETPCGDGVMVWRSWGEGPPLVLFHGSHGSWAHWIRNIDAIAKRRRIYAADLPGYGESALPPRPEDGASHGEVLAAGLRQLLGDQAPVDVAGFSMGGVLACHMAAKAPELVRRVILLDSGGIDTPLGDISLVRTGRLEGEELRQAVRANLLSLMLHKEESADDLAVHVQMIVTRQGRIPGAALVLPHQLQDVLEHVEPQVDLIWGRYDNPHPDPELQLQVLRRQKPDAQMRVIEDAGHWVMYDSPEACNAALFGLLDQPLRKRA